MKIAPVFALLAVCVPSAAPFVAHAQTADMPAAEVPAVAALVPLPMAPKSAATSDAFVWRFAPPVGSRWTMRSFVRSISRTQTPAMGGQKAQSVQVKLIQKMTADYDVLSRDALGATTIRLTLHEMTNDVNLISDGKTMPSPLNQKADPRAVNGAQLTIKQSSDGKIWGVVGMRAFQRKILEANGALDAATIDQVLNANPMIGNKDMIKSMSMMSGTLPTSPVRVGESWNYDASLPAPLALDISGTRTLKALDSEIAVVADSATYAGGAQMKMPTTPAMGGVSVDYSQLTGAVSGVSRVQRSSGLPLESTVNQTIAGSISTQIPTMDGVAAQQVTVPMNVTSSARVVMEPR